MIQTFPIGSSGSTRLENYMGDVFLTHFIVVVINSRKFVGKHAC